MMLLSIALILLLGYLGGYLASKIKIPGLVMMIIVGLIIGPFVLNLIDPKILTISSELRQIALVIILTRSGLSLDFSSLKKMGRPALLMSFLPALFEIIAVSVAAHLLLGFTLFEGVLLGSVLAAVSPAVVSPRMLKLIEEGYGSKREVPKLVLAGASVDDIFVIVVFYAFLSIVETNNLNPIDLLLVPVSIVLGILIGIIVGLILGKMFSKMNGQLIVKVILLFALSLALVGLESVLKVYFSFSSLLAILVMSMMILLTNQAEAFEIGKSYKKLWTIFEIILFVLVGASLDLSVALSELPSSLLILIIGLLFRTLGVLMSVSFTKFNHKEKLFIVISYLPKATVQASIGGIALSLGLSSGSLILAISVISILITAPLGALLIDQSAKFLLLKKEDDKERLTLVSQED